MVSSLTVERRSLKRRGIRSIATLAVMGMALAACGAESDDSDGTSSSPGGAAQEVLIGGLWPLSGPYAFNGEAVVAGANAAVEDINEAGGISSLGGAKVRLEVADAGGTPQTATAAANRLLGSEDVLAVAGSWASALTLAASEVTERRGIPMVSESFADDVTGRDGFSHTFSYAPPSSQLGPLLVDASLNSLRDGGVEVERAAIIGDNSPGGTPLQEALVETLSGEGVEVALYEQWTPPLQDASGIAQKIASADAQVIYLIAFSFNDVSSLIRDIRARGITAPIIQSGGQGVLPQWRDVGDSIIGMSSMIYTNPLSKSTELANSIAERSGEDYVWQDQIGGYAAISIIAAALEQAGSANPEDINKALHELDLDSGPVVELLPNTTFTFDESGRVAPPTSVLAQWQEVDGALVPCTVYPAEVAVCQAQW